MTTYKTGDLVQGTSDYFITKYGKGGAIGVIDERQCPENDPCGAFANPETYVPVTWLRGPLEWLGCDGRSLSRSGEQVQHLAPCAFPDTDTDTDAKIRELSEALNASREREQALRFRLYRAEATLNIVHDAVRRTP